MQDQSLDTVEALVHLGEARGVPEFGCEIAVALDALRAEPDVVALRRHGGQREAQGVGAIFLDHAKRIDDVALRLRHFRAGGIAHQAVDVGTAHVDGTAALLCMKCNPIIIIRATQKKMMSKPVTSVEVG